MVASCVHPRAAPSKGLTSRRVTAYPLTQSPAPEASPPLWALSVLVIIQEGRTQGLRPLQLELLSRSPALHRPWPQEACIEWTHSIPHSAHSSCCNPAVSMALLNGHLPTGVFFHVFRLTLSVLTATRGPSCHGLFFRLFCELLGS